MMKMILNFRYFFFGIFLSTSIFAQNNETPDSLRWLKFELPDEVLNYQFSQLFFEDQINTSSFLNTDLFDSNSVWIQTRMMLNTFKSDNQADEIWKANILNPLQDKFIKSKQMKFWNTVLATVQVGAVGYLAYKHLKKYGFLKKK